MEDLFIIAGLGNPGAKYTNTWHNAGFSVIDILAKMTDIGVNKLKFKALIGEGRYKGKRIILVKPQTYMNLSGESLRDILDWYKIPLENLLVIYDDIDIPIGKIRLRKRGSSGSHNGMKSIIYNLNADDFPRLRIGIGKPPQNWDLADYVLSAIPRENWEEVFESYKNACQVVGIYLEDGIETAMNKFNSK
jgi:peptidyl-tRNA hydrolase, PTH1 family